MTQGLYFCSLAAPGDETRLMDGLPAYRKQKAEKYLHMDDRILCAASWRLLRLAVQRACGVDAFAVKIGFDALRKPFFADYPRVHFNISHCKTAIACAVDPLPCGVDIEALKPACPQIINRFMPEYYDEFDGIADKRQRDEYFIRLWTKSESIYKTGKSGQCSAPPCDVPENYRVYHFKRDNYYIALCSASGPAELTEIEFERLF